MPKILVNLTNKEDKALSVYKILNGLKSKEQAIRLLIQRNIPSFNEEILNKGE